MGKCPKCGAEMMKGLALYFCVRCDWTEPIEADDWGEPDRVSFSTL